MKYHTPEERKEARRIKMRGYNAKSRAKYPEKSRARVAAYRLTHQEQIREKMRRWKAANKEHLSAYQAAHREEMRLYQRDYYASHKKEWYEKGKAFRLANPEKSHIYEKRYFAKYPEQYQVRNSQRRARKREVSINDLTRQQWQEIKDAFDNRCAYCHRRMKNLSQDHITPLGPEGPHTLHNIVPACRSCNSKKGRKAPPVPVQPLLLTLAAPRTSKKK